MRANRSNDLAALRAGISLIELLVVTIIVLMVSAVTLRQLAPAVSSRNLREAARLINTMLNGARNRAIYSGRPMGIWIERQPGLPEASSSVFYAGVPELYTGDIANSYAKAFVVAPAGALGWGITSTQDYAYCVAPRLAESSALWGSTLSLYVQPGDQIRLGFNSPWYTLQRYCTATPSLTFTVSPLSPATGVAATKYWIIGTYVPRKDQLAIPIGYQPYPSDLPDDPTQLTQGSATNSDGLVVPYQIQRQPQKLAAGAVTLPESAIIDLNFSGLGSAPSKGAVNNLPFWPRTVASYSATANAYNYTGTYTPATIAGADQMVANRPVIITFNSMGSVDKLYTVYGTSTGISTSFVWSSITPVEPIFLLVGKSEKVPYVAPTAGTNDTVKNQMMCNYADPENNYVVIHPTTGLVTTSPVAATGVSTTAVLTTSVSIVTFVNASRASAARFSTVGAK